MFGVARVGFPGWVAHPEVWLIAGLLIAGYFVAIQRVGPRLVAPGEAVVQRRHVVSFGGAMVAFVIASDYPIHDLAERYLYSVHMVQHLLLSMVFVPLMIRATPPWLARYVLERTRTLGALRYCSRFFPAVFIFNILVIVTHIPEVVSAGLNSGWVHFGLHTVIVLAGFAIWMPILSPVPEIPRLTPPLQMFYMFLQSIVPTIPAAFLSYGKHAVYREYESFDRLWGISSHSDETVAALIMKTGSGLIMWTVIGIVFFRWFAAEEAPRPRRKNENKRPRRKKLATPTVNATATSTV